MEYLCREAKPGFGINVTFALWVIIDVTKFALVLSQDTLKYRIWLTSLTINNGLMTRFTGSNLGVDLTRYYEAIFLNIIIINIFYNAMISKRQSHHAVILPIPTLNINSRLESTWSKVSWQLSMGRSLRNATLDAIWAQGF